MDKEAIEALRKMQELNYRQLDSSAIVVVEMEIRLRIVGVPCEVQSCHRGGIERSFCT